MKVFGINNFNHTNENDIIKENYPIQNILNILGWFPFLGTVIGSIRIGSDIIIYIADDNSNEYSHKKYYIISTTRGIVEIFSLGFVFIIPDIIASVTKKRKLSKLK